MKEVKDLKVFQIVSMVTHLIKTGTFLDMGTVCYASCKSCSEIRQLHNMYINFCLCYFTGYTDALKDFTKVNI